MRMLRFILPVLLAVVVWSCVGRRDRRLDRADALACVNPGLALELLDSIDTSQLDKENLARFGLLRAKAADKSYRHIYNDSLISFSADYFTGRGDSLEIQALYYYGFGLSQQGNIDHALIALHEAYDKAVKTDNYFFAGMSARELANDYRVQLIRTRQLDFARKAKHYFTLAGANKHADWINLITLDGLIYSGFAEKADHMCDSLINSREADDLAFKT